TPGTVRGWTWLGSTTTLATEYDRPAMESLVEYTIRSGSASHLPGAATRMAGYGRGRNVGCEGGLRKSWPAVTVVRTVWTSELLVRRWGPGIESTGTERAA